MFKKFVSGLLALYMLITLTGCTGAGSGLTNEEMGQIAEYAAKMVLSRTKGYEPKLLPSLEVAEEKKEVKEDFQVIGEKEEPVSEDRSMTHEKRNDEENETPSENTVKSLNDVFLVPGFEVIYTGVREVNKYPENGGYFSLVAPDGMKLMVVEFHVKNKTGKTAVFKQSDDMNYELRFGETSYQPSITLLENDIKFFEEKIEGKKSKKAVVLFNVPKTEKKSKAKLKVSGKNGNYYLSVGQ